MTPIRLDEKYYYISFNMFEHFIGKNMKKVIYSA
jgi:hypothetical protein